MFKTDFGIVGLLICYDQMFPEAARALRLQGAEILCISTAGEAKLQQQARALDNGMYVVVAGTNGDPIQNAAGVWVSDRDSEPILRDGSWAPSVRKTRACWRSRSI